MSVNPIRVTVWNEYLHERTQADVAAIYPDGIHEALAAPLREAGFAVRTATQDQPEHGLTEAVLAETDVLLWWGHRLTIRSMMPSSTASRRGCWRAWG